jgi:hypothetical protein
MFTRPPRLLSASICALFLGGIQLASYHQATAQHGYCPEHGALVHLGHNDQPRGQGPRYFSSIPAPIFIPDAQLHTAHDCAELAFLGQSSQLEDTRSSLTPTGRSALLAGAARLAVSPIIALLRQAPKNSPPGVNH